MIDVTLLPYDLRDVIFSIYAAGVRLRLHRRVFGHVAQVCGADKCACWLDWLAHALQYPQTKPTRGVAFVGDPTGKAACIDLLSRLMPTCQGHDMVQSSWMAHPALEAARAVVVHEPSHRLIPEVCSLISDSVIFLRRPGQPTRIVDSFHRMVVLPGSYFPEILDRRLLTIRCCPPVESLSISEIHWLKVSLMHRPIHKDL